MLAELLDAQTQSYILGLTLGLPLAQVDAIHDSYTNPPDRLLQVIIAFFKGVEPSPTWRVIVAALRSPAVNLPALAKRVEAAHFPDPTSTRDVVPETSTGMTPLNYDCMVNSVSIISAGESVASATTDTSGDVVKASPLIPISSSGERASFT